MLGGVTKLLVGVTVLSMHTHTHGDSMPVTCTGGLIGTNICMFQNKLLVALNTETKYHCALARL